MLVKVLTQKEGDYDHDHKQCNSHQLHRHCETKYSHSSGVCLNPQRENYKCAKTALSRFLCVLW